MLNFIANGIYSIKTKLSSGHGQCQARFVCNQVLPVSRWTLRFSGDYAHLENNYRERNFACYLNHIRRCHWLAIFLYAVYGLLDLRLVPDLAGSLLTIRLGIVCPLILLALIVSYASWYERIWTWVLMTLVLITAIGYMIIANMVPPVYNFGCYVGVVACLIFGYAYTRLPTTYATAAGWLVSCLYWLLGAQSDPFPEGVLINQVFYLFGLNLLLMVVCYTRERSDRNNFFLSHLLSAERDKVTKINEGLEEAVKFRTIALENANTHLNRVIEAHKASEAAKEYLAKQLRQAQKMEAIGTLAGGIAHDFNNILSSIIGFTELALDDADPESFQQSNLEEVMTAGKRARDLVRQILAFSRQGEQVMHSLELSKTIEEARTLLRATLPTSIAIEVDIRSQITILGDPSQLSQVLMNLGINAGHAVGNGGGRLSYILDKTLLPQAFCDQHPGTRPGWHACLSVEDNGQGIPEEILDRIFDPFYTTKPQGQGTGLGLSVVHGIVKNHGGAITVTSKVGQGTLFNIYLPILEDVVVEESSVDVEIPGGHERILCVDDEQSLLNYTRQTLLQLGYNVTTRNDPLEALELFKTKHHHFDLVITDLTMPHMNGDVLAEKIRRVSPAIPIILCSGMDTRARQQRMEPPEISAVINKPILRTELAQAVREVLDQTGCG